MIMNFDVSNMPLSLRKDFFPALEAGRLSHAVILEGGDDDSRLAAAKYAAAALTCEGGGKKPCGECGSCFMASAGSHPDIIETAAANGSKSISVEAVRKIRSMAYIFPIRSDKKVFLMRGADAMTEQAQNALLKILEEPPSFVVFILECRSRGALIPTVLSRADVYSLGAEKSRAADLERLNAARETAQKLAFALCEGSEWAVMRETGVFEKDRELLRLCLPELILILRGALVSKFNFSDDDIARSLASRFTKTRLLGIICAVNDCLLSTESNVNHNLAITRLVSATAAERIY